MKGFNHRVRKAITATIAISAFVSGASWGADLADEKVILDQFYDATKGASWNPASNWKTEADVCKWQGIDCDAAKEHVVTISLAARNLAGPLPEELTGLTELNTLILNSNKLTGTIPENIGDLSKLADLELDRNQLEGSLPASMANLTALRTLFIFSNKLTGKISPDLDTVIDTLAQNSLNLEYNGLYSDANSNINDSTTQTLDAEVISISPDKTSATITWAPVSYTEAGGYEIVLTNNNDGNDFVTTVAGKDSNQTIVQGLQPGTDYTVVVRSFTNPHDHNLNKVTSDGQQFPGKTLSTIDNDSDGDGIGDNAEGKKDGLDSDKDGTPDYIDSDDDNDGILTKNELPTDLDTDGDGTPNYLDDDDDGDGVLTKDEPDGLDTDKNSIPNYLDKDDDGDGILTADELPVTNDEDGDGIPDYLDVKSKVLEETADKDAGGSGTTKPTVITSLGGGSMGLGLALFGLLGFMRKKNLQRIMLLPLAIASLLFSGLAAAEEGTDEPSDDMTATSGVTIERSQDTGNRGGRAYIGLGAGLSWLDPETKNTSVNVDDDQDFGAKLTLGYEISPFLALEGFASKLGEATFKPSGSIDYNNYGLGIVYNLFGHTAGFTPILSLGATQIDNSSSSVNYKRDENILGYAGLGVEYEFANTIALRGEYQYFAEDVQFLSLNVIKRFGGQKTKTIIVQQPAPPPQPAPAPIIIPAPAPAPTTIAPVWNIPDSDGDGISDIGDKCPNTPAGASIDEMGCAMFEGVLQGVNFETNSSRLTAHARSILDQVANELANFPKIKIEVQAHTDSKGSNSYNQALSGRRAQSVINYLASRGLSTRRMIPVGYGETRPIADNKTEAGRAQNRRVQFVVLKSSR